MPVPHAPAGYEQYRKIRGNLALAKKNLLPLQMQGKLLALHPSKPEIQTLFYDQKLSFVANVGPLIEPVSKSDFYSNTKPLPLGLMSHADQFRHWQTARPGERINQGWFGAFAGALQPAKTGAGEIPMNISLAGNNYRL